MSIDEKDLAELERLVRVFENRVADAWVQDATASDARLKRLHADMDKARDALLSSLRQARAERNALRSLLASLADTLNIAAREHGLPEVERYTDLDAMRGAVDALAIRATRYNIERDAASALAQDESLRAGTAVAVAQGLRAELAEARALLERRDAALDDCNRMAAQMRVHLEFCRCECGVAVQPSCQKCDRCRGIETFDKLRTAPAREETTQ